MPFVRSLFALVVCAAAVIAPAPAVAGAPGWSASSMAAAKTYFPVGTTVMVVGVDAAARPVVTALLESMQASDTFELVIDARALGKIEGLADDEIVRRAFGRPIQRVAIVQVFPAGSSVKAVVTVYAAQGQVTTAFTLAPGKTLAENPSPEAAEDGVRRDEMQNVQSTTGVAGIAPASGDGDEVTYKREVLVGVSGYGVVNLENVSFFKNGRLISDTPSLYEALGMADRATEYRSRDANHGKWMRRGGVLSAVGVLGTITFGTWALVAGRDQVDYNTGATIEGSRTTPLLLTAASAAAMIAGIYMVRANPGPRILTQEEAVSLVDAHKAKRHRAARAGGVRPASELYLAPSATTSGAGFVMAGTF